MMTMKEKEKIHWSPFEAAGKPTLYFKNQSEINKNKHLPDFFIRKLFKNSNIFLAANA